jgi:hypothetical protein
MTFVTLPEQVTRQCPSRQASPFWQAFPQVPQLAGSVSGFTHCPLHILSLSVPQQLQYPLLQIALAGQVIPQPPQFSVSL